MELPADKVYKVLSSMGVDALYHANSVLTASHFLSAGALLSRGSTERLGKGMTEQSSDSIDQQRSLWFDVFMDTVDIHARIAGLNHYGPVSLCLDSEIIAQPEAGNIWITKLNPTKWNKRSHKDRWFTSISELRRDFQPGTFDHMIVVRHSGGQLCIGKFLKRVTLDNPKLVWGDVDYLNIGRGALRLAMTQGGFNHIRIKTRSCNSDCKCVRQYRNDVSLVKQMFEPRA